MWSRPAFGLQQSHRRQFLTRFVPAKLLSANIDREAGVEPARNDVIPPAFATNLREGPTRFLVSRDATCLRCSPASIRPALLSVFAHDVVCASSNINRFDPSDPVIRFKLPRSERRDHFEHLIGESPDVQ